MNPGALKLSVVVSTYNRARLLDVCIASLLTTDAAPESWELIIIDDGSTDETTGSLRRWQLRLTERQINFRPLRREMNAGAYNNAGLARNCGLRNAKGIAIAFSDGDCVYLTDAIGETIGWLDEGGRGFLTSAEWYRISKDASGGWGKIGPRGANQSNPFGPWLAIRRSVIMELGGFDERFTTYGAEDEDMVTRLIREKHEPQRTPQIIAVHLWHTPGARTADREQWNRQIAICRSDRSTIRNVGTQWGQLK